MQGRKDEPVRIPVKTGSSVEEKAKGADGSTLAVAALTVGEEKRQFEMDARSESPSVPCEEGDTLAATARDFDGSSEPDCWIVIGDAAFAVWTCACRRMVVRANVLGQRE